MIYKNDTAEAYDESHYICKVNANNELLALSTPLYFDNKIFEIYLDAQQKQEISLNTANAQYCTLDSLIGYANSVDSMLYGKVFDAIEEEPEPIEEYIYEEEPESEEPEEMITSEDIATLDESKDLFIKVNFSNNVEDIVFMAPTGGIYTTLAGNVEMMRDDNVTNEVFYRIPNAEMGVWSLQYDKALNDIEVETVTDNKIKINDAQLSAIKDGLVTVSASLLMNKKTNIDYEYHVDIIDQTGVTVEHATNVLNSKSDKPNYTVSVMDLNPGTYKVRLRLEYICEEQKFFNIFTTNDLVIE